MDTFSQLKQEAQELLSTAKGSHDWDHTERVYALCMHIGEIERADLDILKYAARLHDIGRGFQDSSNGIVCHAEKGAEIAKSILKIHNIETEKIEKIIHCIETHRFRGKNIPESKEARILFDADKLDSIGAVGIGRAFLFSGEIGAKLHNDRIDIEKTKQYTKEDTAYREYIIKLCKVHDRLLTKEGRRIGQERHKFMQQFFEQLMQEVNGKK